MEFDSLSKSGWDKYQYSQDYVSTGVLPVCGVFAHLRPVDLVTIALAIHRRVRVF